MEKISFDEQVILAVSVNERIQFLEWKIETSSAPHKADYHEELEQAKYLLRTIRNSVLYAVDRSEVNTNRQLENTESEEKTND